MTRVVIEGQGMLPVTTLMLAAGVGAVGAQPEVAQNRSTSASVTAQSHEAAGEHFILRTAIAVQYI
jgi:hypothetical protein